ncbi:hypothetical protein F5Y16DRAFT_397131 [Xylariaceae sp. FL0255]|nr:hypothetical protein F5Y16DRAFT_397131 [Xylariaceae sp. FL0255]
MPQPMPLLPRDTELWDPSWLKRVLHFDGSSDAYVKDFKTFGDAFKDPECTEKIQPQELAFIDVENIQMTIGYDNVVLQEHARTFHISLRPAMLAISSRLGE